MSIVDELYPFVTQDGKAIPLDIIRPSAMIYVEATLEWQAIVIPAGCEVASIKATADCYLDTTNTATVAPVSGAANTGWLFIPAGFVVVAALQVGTLRLRGAEEVGIIIIQGLRKWAALALPRQLTNKTS